MSYYTLTRKIGTSKTKKLCRTYFNIKHIYFRISNFIKSKFPSYSSFRVTKDALRSSLEAHTFVCTHGVFQTVKFIVIFIYILSLKEIEHSVILWLHLTCVQAVQPCGIPSSNSNSIQTTINMCDLSGFHQKNEKSSLQCLCTLLLLNICLAWLVFSSSG